ncbi:MAG: hypothetical protein E6G76_16565 [Alphaproteobacteria bacterium]|nr:MAG: hypothetical protein E6G76_16565 [Alphaproteobacteria bacterium]
MEDQPASGGLTLAKNSQEISKPTQITKPNRLMSQVAPSARCSTAVPSACSDKAEFSIPFAKFATIFFYFDAKFDYYMENNTNQ